MRMQGAVVRVSTGTGESMTERKAALIKRSLFECNNLFIIFCFK